MTPSDERWTATVTVRPLDPHLVLALERALRPEAEREVPRARATLRRTEDGTLELSVAARDSGAMRAALNTYLGWIQLSLATVRSASNGPPAPPAP